MNSCLFNQPTSYIFHSFVLARMKWPPSHIGRICPFLNCSTTPILLIVLIKFHKIDLTELAVSSVSRLPQFQLEEEKRWKKKDKNNQLKQTYSYCLSGENSVCVLKSATTVGELGSLFCRHIGVLINGLASLICRIYLVALSEGKISQFNSVGAGEVKLMSIDERFQTNLMYSICMQHLLRTIPGLLSPIFSTHGTHSGWSRAQVTRSTCSRRSRVGCRIQHRSWTRQTSQSECPIWHGEAEFYGPDEACGVNTTPFVWPGWADKFDTPNPRKYNLEGRGDTAIAWSSSVSLRVSPCSDNQDKISLRTGTVIK